MDFCIHCELYRYMGICGDEEAKEVITFLPSNHRAALDAAVAVCLHALRCWRGASERGR